MLNRNKAADVFDRIQRYSTADEVEALFYAGHSSLTRFANNTIHQNVAEENSVVSVRTAFGERTARATTNKLDEESLKRAVKSAEDISVTMLAADSSGWQKANSPNVAHLDAVALAEIAARKAVESASPREIPAGKYTVILEPAAVLDIVGFMFFDFGGLAILDQRSFLNNRVGTKIFGENINISDDVGHPLQSAVPFDGEGMRRQRVHLVEGGVVKRLVYARATAEKMKKSEHRDKVGVVEPTGHGFPIPNEMGEAPMNIVFGASTDPKTVDQMIASTERGLLVTRLWYTREVDPYEKILTGMTRDGTFY